MQFHVATCLSLDQTNKQTQFYNIYYCADAGFNSFIHSFIETDYWPYPSSSNAG